MIAAGIDIGSTTTKTVLVEGDIIRASTLFPSGNLPAETAMRSFKQALQDAGLTESDVGIIATTGYGRRLIEIGDVVMTEIKACAAGARFHASPDSPINTIIDVGGQDTKVVALDDDGHVEDFGMNDKCAAGTGRFLEMLAIKLELSYEEFVAEALKSDTTIQMNATCAVFAESEVVGLLARKVSKADIAAAAHKAIALRISAMVRRSSRRNGYCFVGGGALNAALVKAMEEQLGEPIRVAPDAQKTVALGAATLAYKKLAKGS